MEEEFQNMKKRMDELNNAVKGKGERNLDRMNKQIASPFTVVVLDLPLPQKFRLPSLVHSMDQRTRLTASSPSKA